MLPHFRPPGWRPGVRGRRYSDYCTIILNNLKRISPSQPTIHRGEGTMPSAINGGLMFEALLEAAPDAIVAVDREGVIRLVNAQTEQLFGYNREELLGHAVEVLVPDVVRGVHPAHRAEY